MAEMTLSAPIRAAIVTFLAWLILVTISQTIRGGTIVPPAMTPLSFWGLMTVIATLLALCAYVVTALIVFMTGAKK